MIRLALQSEDIEEAQICSEPELRAQLLQIHERFSNKPTLVSLDSPNGCTLMLGLGREQCIALFLEPGGWPSFVSVGDASLDGLIEFAICGEVTEFHARHGIPLDAAIDAAISFYRFPERCDCVIWEQD